PHGRALETLDLPPLLADVPAAYRVGLVFIVSLPDVRFDIMCRDQRLDRRKRLRVNHIRGPLAQHEVRAEFREVASDGIFIGPRRVAPIPNSLCFTHVPDSANLLDSWFPPDRSPLRAGWARVSVSLK